MKLRDVEVTKGSRAVGNMSILGHQRERTETRTQQPATNDTLKKLTFLTVWAIIFLAVFAFPLSQNAKSRLQKLGRERPDSPLESLERDIAGSKFEAIQPRLISYLQVHPNSWRAHYDLGYVQFRTHEIGSSIIELSKSLELNPENAEAHKILALKRSVGFKRARWLPHGPKQKRVDRPV